MSEVELYNPEMFETYELDMKQAVYDYYYMPTTENHNRIAEAICGMIFATCYIDTITEPAEEAFNNWIIELDKQGYEGVIWYNFSYFSEYQYN